jgi:dihydrofolate synthase / folylpolyglutamate synthase
MSTPNSLDEWLTHISQVHYLTVDLSVSRIQAVAKKLKLLTPKALVITVGGTNGKGSTIKCLESIYTAADFRVGCYTSPHLYRYNERITFCGEEACDEDLSAAFSYIDHGRDDIALTFFEFTVLAALYYFQEKACDVILLEVGVGGRMDAVNIIDPDLAVITNVSLDHVAWLGDTREKIAYEKAGILREGGRLVCADRAPPQTLKDEVARLGVSALWIDHDFDVLSVDRYCASVHILKDNAAAAIAAVLMMEARLSVPPDAMATGIKNLKMPGRCERIDISDKVQLFFDVAHNSASVQNLRQACVGPVKPTYRIAVFSALADKVLPDLVLPMQDLMDAWFIGGLNRVDRGRESHEILSEMKTLGVQSCYNRDTVNLAMKDAMHWADQQQELTQIVVFGSFHTVAIAKQYVSSLNA